MIAMRKLVVWLLGILLIGGGTAYAAWDDAPVPKRSPIAPVSQQSLVKPALPPSRTVTGAATMLDTERLRIGDVEMRLFGVIPPQLSASYGPQARALLDGMTTGVNVSCVIRDRDHDGRFLATCQGANNDDLAQELLRRGLAVTARGSLHGTELETIYAAAEQAAQLQKLGLWSISLPSAVSENSIRDAVATITPPPPPVVVEPKKEEAKAASPAPQKIEAQKQTVLPPEVYAQPRVPSALERYQFLITGILMLLTALGVLGGIAFRSWMDKREELRSIAAALRGEMTAARAICLTRLKTLGEGHDDKNAQWPRIRVLVFHAYVGRLGMLGTELSRQIASIYGLASDYASYYGSNHAAEANAAPLSKRQALQTLAQHIDVVLPRLEILEQGKSLRSFFELNRQAKPQTQAQSPTIPPDGGTPLTATSTQPAEQPPATQQQEPEVKPSIIEEETKAAEVTTAAIPETTETTETPAVPSLQTETPSVAVAESYSAPLWDKIRKLAAERLERTKRNIMDEHLTDYAAMSEEELESLSYGLDSDDEKFEGYAKELSKAR